MIIAFELVSLFHCVILSLPLENICTIFMHGSLQTSFHAMDLNVFNVTHLNVFPFFRHNYESVFPEVSKPHDMPPKLPWPVIPRPLSTRLIKRLNTLGS